MDVNLISHLFLQKVPDEIYHILEEGDLETTEIVPDTPQSLKEFITEMKSKSSDARTFALRLKAMVSGRKSCIQLLFIQNSLFMRYDMTMKLIIDDYWLNHCFSVSYFFLSALILVLLSWSQLVLVLWFYCNNMNMVYEVCP